MHRLDQMISLTDGRRLCFAEFGLPSGTPVFFFHGSASSRLDRPDSEQVLTQLGVRFLTVDRPGHGLSDFQPRRRLVDWPCDIVQLADRLDIDRFFVMGHSAGGPHALVCAYQISDRVIAAAVVSSVAPMGRTNAYQGMPLMNQLLARSARHVPWITRLARRMTRGMVVGDVEKATRQLMGSIPDTDKEALYTVKNLEIMVVAIREGYRQGSRAVALDDILVNSEWGFDLEDIKPQIDIWHGEVDVNVPVHAGRYLAEKIPNSRAHILPGEGHFFILSRWGEILAGLLDAGF